MNVTHKASLSGLRRHLHSLQLNEMAGGPNGRLVSKWKQTERWYRIYYYYYY